MLPELELVRQWLERAWTDLDTAAALLNLPRPRPTTVCFHCQQAVEKALKAALIFRDVEFDWSHEIEYLINLCVEQDAAFEQFRASAVPLSDYAVTFRYPADAPDPTVEQAREALAVARAVWQFVLDRLPTETHPEP